MASSIFVFSRDLDEREPHYRQFITVYAPDVSAARGLVKEMFGKFSSSERSSEMRPTFSFDRPEWHVDEIQLEHPRIVTWHTTT